MSDKDQTLHDDAIGWAILFVVLAVLAWLFWIFFDTEIRDVVRWIRYGELWLLSYVLPADYTVNFRGQPLSWHDAFSYVPRWRAEEMGYDHLAFITALTMQPMRWVFSALFALAAFWCLSSGPQTQFRVALNLEGLIRRQAQNFRVIAPFVDFNPGTQPPRPPGAPVPAVLPSFAEALSAEEWLAYHQIPAPDGKIDEAAAFKALSKQLIARWQGAMALQPYQQVLLAAFCLKAARKRKEADALLARLAECWSFKKGLRINGKLLREARSILRNRDLAGKTLAQANRHAFVTTALLRALAFAREEGGVLAPATFVWLRGHDRTLWYPLNNLGRHSFHTEAMGAMAHYKAERMTQRPIPVPKMEDAVKTIVEHMASTNARPIPPLDYKGAGKKGIKKAA
ncbi:MAG: type IV secretion system protein [Alphaproteobacteria bacterium]|nr:type IV secretion system protein [Alphaproteobacteria bacterium]